jgi:WXXGXW repeat (2 copies)
MRNLIRGLIAALALAALAALPALSDAGVFVGVSVNIAPPILPVYVQPACPAPGYFWIPGYWAWAEDGGYYWVPGTWALAPAVGLLWTPGYWGWGGGVYLWHGGYWGPHVGFYGGINYGFGYGGIGFAGGEWRGGQFFYNRSVTNISTTTNITNVYNRTVVNNGTVNHVAFNGGAGGIAARPTAEEQQAANERHVQSTPMQRQHEERARSDTSLRASVNGGRPAIAATQRPGAFTGHGVVGARGAAPAAHAPAAMNRSDRPSQTQHPAAGSRGPQGERPMSHSDRPPQAQHPAAANRGPQGDRPMNHNPGVNRQPGYAGARGPAPGGGAHPAAAPRPGGQPGGQHPGGQERQEQKPERGRG